MRQLSIILILLLSYGVNAQTIEGLGNFYKVNDHLYRSNQPSKKQFEEIEKLGIKTVINLRKMVSDKGKIKKRNFTYVQISMKASEITIGDIRTVLREIDKAEKPVLIHCYKGADRTGCMVAAYRIFKEGWSREDAIKEFLDPKFDYTQELYPNILELLRTMDVDVWK